VIRPSHTRERFEGRVSAALQQQYARRGASARGDHCGLRIRHLTFAGVVAQLGDGLVDEAVAVRAPFRQLPAVRVDRQLAVEGDAATAVDPVLRLADAAEAERLDP